MDEQNITTDKEKIKVLILYDSLFGNTKEVALSLSRGLEEGGILVDCSSILEFESEQIIPYHVIGIGSPTHNRRMSNPMKTFFSQMRKIKLIGKKSFAFETKLDVPFTGSSGKDIIKGLTKMNTKIIYPLITGMVTKKQGPLILNTLKKMKETGLEIAEILYNENKQNEVNKHNET